MMLVERWREFEGSVVSWGVESGCVRSVSVSLRYLVLSFARNGNDVAAGTRLKWFRENEYLIAEATRTTQTYGRF